MPFSCTKSASIFHGNVFEITGSQFFVSVKYLCLVLFILLSRNQFVISMRYKCEGLRHRVLVS